MDGGAPFYNLYRCRDQKFVTVGCLEPHFFAVFLRLLVKNVPANFAADHDWKPTVASQFNREEWPLLKRYIESAFETNTRGFWTQVYHSSSRGFVRGFREADYPLQIQTDAFFHC